MSKTATLGTLALVALAAPVLAVLALLGLAGNAIACTTPTTANLASTAPIPPAARLWIALTHQACPRLPEPWIAAVMSADSGFTPAHTSPDGRGLITINDAQWRLGRGTDPMTDADHNGLPDITDPLIESAVAGTILCDQLADVDTYRTGHPASAQRLSAVDGLTLVHIASIGALDAYPTMPADTATYVARVQRDTAAWTASTADPSSASTESPTSTASPAAGASVDPACMASLGNAGTVVVPPDTPRDVADAIRTALALVGTRSGFTNRCDHLACLAYGYSNSGYPNASAHWRTMLATGHAHPGDHCPPAGAFMFWATRGPDGHVSLVEASDPGCDPAKIELVSNDVLNNQTGYTGGVYLVTLAQIENGFVSRAGYEGWTDPVCAGSRT